jgi:cellulose synthase/poly-beta-1,6-N-acetylglucosamine synthase-like glycosyltransferase
MSTFLPEISVIIPIYNGESELPDLLDCLKAQTYPRDKVEYLLVDNNSQDNTGQLLAKAQESQIIPLTPLAENQIQSSYAARNRGIRSARHDILAFTDMDCRPSQEWLIELVKPFVDTSIGIVAGEVKALPSENFFEKYSERSDFMNQKYLLEHPFCPYGQTANLAVRKVAFQEVGLFRPYLTTGGDADICWRIQRETDWKLTYSPEAIIFHRHRSSLKDLRSQLKRYGTSNRYLHDLHGVDLMKEFKNEDLVQGLRRWIFKDIPKNTVKLFLGKADILDVLKSPVDLICFESRSTGQKTAILPENAREIEWL